MVMECVAKSYLGWIWGDILLPHALVGLSGREESGVMVVHCGAAWIGCNML